MESESHIMFRNKRKETVFYVSNSMKFTATPLQITIATRYSVAL